MSAKRCKRIPIDNDLLTSLFAGRSEVHSKLPDGMKLVCIYPDFHAQCLFAVVEHPDFEPVENGSLIPTATFEVTWWKKALAPERDI